MFLINHIVEFLGSSSYAAKKGALAVVSKEIDDEKLITIIWDKADPRRCGQTDGQYEASDFILAGQREILIPRFKQVAEEL